jgi:hypothetical protein
MATLRNSTVNKVSVFVDSNLKHLKLTAPKQKKLNRLLDVNREVKGFTDDEAQFLADVVEQIAESIKDEAENICFDINLSLDGEV